MNDDLYADPEVCQAILMDYYRNPRCSGTCDPATHAAEETNPACGDIGMVTLRLEDGVIREARTAGAGCAVSQAAASLLMERIEGTSLHETAGILKELRDFLGGDSSATDSLDRLNALRVIVNNPARVRCAGLACEAVTKLLA